MKTLTEFINEARVKTSELGNYLKITIDDVVDEIMKFSPDRIKDWNALILDDNPRNAFQFMYIFGELKDIMLPIISSRTGIKLNNLLNGKDYMKFFDWFDYNKNEIAKQLKKRSN